MPNICQICDNDCSTYFACKLCKYLQCRSCIEMYIKNNPAIVYDIPTNYVRCLSCLSYVNLSGCKLNKYDVSSIRETINQVKFILMEKKIRQECEMEMNEKIKQLGAATAAAAAEKPENNAEVMRLFTEFENLLYMKRPCCKLAYTSDGCQAIFCDECNC